VGRTHALDLVQEAVARTLLADGVPDGPAAERVRLLALDVLDLVPLDERDAQRGLQARQVEDLAERDERRVPADVARRERRHDRRPAREHAEVDEVRDRHHVVRCAWRERGGKAAGAGADALQPALSQEVMYLRSLNRLSSIRDERCGVVHVTSDRKHTAESGRRIPAHDIVDGLDNGGAIQLCAARAGGGRTPGRIRGEPVVRGERGYSGGGEDEEGLEAERAPAAERRFQVAPNREVVGVVVRGHGERRGRAGREADAPALDRPRF
jgi:hypothetical protein